MPKREILIEAKTKPKTVIVQGLPFMLQGWNSRHELKEIDGLEAYVSESYILYPWFFGGFKIKSTRILQVSGEEGPVWVFQVLETFEWVTIGKKINYDLFPCGRDWFLDYGGRRDFEVTDHICCRAL